MKAHYFSKDIFHSNQKIRKEPNIMEAKYNVSPYFHN